MDWAIPVGLSYELNCGIIFEARYNAGVKYSVDEFGFPMHTVGARVVVDERHPVNPSGLVLADHRVDVSVFEVTDKLVLCPGRVYRPAHLVAGGRPDFRGEAVEVLLPAALQLFYPYVLPDAAGLDRYADALPDVGRGRVDDAVIGFAFGFALDLLQLDVVEAEQRVQFGQRPEFVLLGEQTNCRGDLLLDIDFAVFDLFKFVQDGGLAAFGRDQMVLAFQIFANRFRALEVIAVADRLTVCIHPDGHEVQMLAFYVPMTEYIIGLVPESHAFHVLLRDSYLLFVGQLVIGMRTERHMKNRIAYTILRMEAGRKAHHSPVHIKRGLRVTRL